MDRVDEVDKVDSVDDGRALTAAEGAAHRLAVRRAWRDEHVKRPDLLPSGWSVEAYGEDGYRFVCRGHGLIVIQTVDLQKDGQLWLHTSVSRRSRMPEYRDMKLVHRLFVGEARLAIHLFVPEREHVNIHPYCLHLWTPLGANPLPDFRVALIGGVYGI